MAFSCLQWPARLPTEKTSFGAEVYPPNFLIDVHSAAASSNLNTWPQPLEEEPASEEFSEPLEEEPASEASSCASS